MCELCALPDGLWQVQLLWPQTGAPPAVPLKPLCLPASVSSGEGDRMGRVAALGGPSSEPGV